MAEINPLLKEIEQISNFIQQVSDEKSYWLVRTESGTFYETFRNDNFVAIGYEEITLHDIYQLNEKHGNNYTEIKRNIKEICKNKYKDKNVGLIASQIYRFVYELKKNDIVVIPSHNSEVISIGRVLDSIIPNSTGAELEKCGYKKRKKIKWLKDIARDRLDLGLYKMLTTHQALSNITHHSGAIERAVGNLYVHEHEVNLILEVERDENINAMDLFAMGHFLLKYTEGFISQNDLHISVNDMDVKINLNSKGKIQLKTPTRNIAILVALIVVGLNGGGLKFTFDNVTFDLSTDGLIKKLDEYQNDSHDRSMKDTLIKTMENLELKSPNDVINVIKQFSANKDKPQ